MQPHRSVFEIIVQGLGKEPYYSKTIFSFADLRQADQELIKKNQ